MLIKKLQNNEIIEFSKLTKNIIKTTNYYNNTAKKEETKKYSLENLKRVIKNKNKKILIAKENNQIIGFCNGNYDCGIFWLDWIGTDKKHRRKGTAIALIEELEKQLKIENIPKIWCDSRKNNKESIKLLKKLGFKKITTIKHHWYGEDYCLWEKFLKN